MAMRAVVTGVAVSLVGCALVGCGSKQTAKYTRPSQIETTDTLIKELLEFTATSDDRGIAHMLTTPLGYGGLWFPDTTCRRQFSGAGVIPESGIDVFATCL